MTEIPSEISALADRLEQEAPGYLREPIPVDLDRDIDDLITTYLSSGAPTRIAIRDAVTPSWARKLAVYGERMAIASVRTGSEDRLFQGLVAAGLSIGNEDYREVVRVLAPIYRSAQHLEVDPQDLFTRAAETVGGDLPTFFGDFPQRPDIDEILTVMGYKEQGSGEDFIYLPSWYTPREGNSTS